MASYNLIRTAEAQPIGSVVPWVGALTKIPKGWLLCAGDVTLNASEYPLLARILRDTYGGEGFTGTFPNYSGTFKLPFINQKAIADISVSYFTSVSLSQPTLNIDTPAAAAVVSQYIGTEGDLGPPASVAAITDLNLSFTPDPDGIITAFNFTGTAATSSQAVLYTNVLATTTSGTGSGARFNVVKNTDGTYTVQLKQKGSNYTTSSVLSIPFNLVGGASSANNITINVTSVGNGFFAGTVTASNGGPLTFTPGFGIATIYVVPRKLGRQHMPQHFHTGTYNTINKNDSADQPGSGVGVFDNATLIVQDWPDCLYPASACLPSGGGRSVNTGSCAVKNATCVWGTSSATGQISVTAPFDVGVGRYSIASVAGTLPARTHTALYSASAAHGVGKSWFNEAKNLRDSNGNSSVSGNPYLNDLKGSGTSSEVGKIKANTRLPFSDDTTLNYYINYDDGLAGGQGSDLAQSYQKVMFNNAATSFTRTTRANLRVNDVIQSHDHQGSFNVTYNKGSLTLPTSIVASAQPNVTPDDVPAAFQITFTIATPSLAITNLIRAY